MTLDTTKIYPRKLVRVHDDNGRLEFTLLCECHDEDMDLLAAIKAAAKDFLETPEGKAMAPELAENGGVFDIGEFDTYVPNTICLKHGFQIVDRTDDYVDIQIDEDLTAPETNPSET